MSIDPWCHPTISSSVIPFSSCPQSFPASGSFPVSQFFTSGGQSIEVSGSASVLPMSIQDWFPLDGQVGSPCCPRNSQESSPTQQLKNINSLVLSFLYSPLSRRYMTTGKTTALTRQTFVGKVMSLLFNTLSRLVITFLPRSKRLLISWLQSPSAVILEPQNIKSASLHCFSNYLSWSNGTRCLIFVFWILSFKQTFSLSSFTFIKRLFSYYSSFSAIRVVSSVYLRLLIFLPAILIPAYASSSPEFLMMYSAYKLNKQCDNIQPWCTPFPIWNQSLLFHVQF